MIKSIFVFASSALGLISGVVDVSFLQDVSHRATSFSTQPIADWDVLGFNTAEIDSSAIIHLEAQQSFFILTGDKLFCSNKKEKYDKIHLENPYQKFSEFFTVGQSTSAIVESQSPDYSFFVVSDTNILGFKLISDNSTNTCGQIESVTEVLSQSVKWGNVLSVTTSEYQLWIVSSDLGLTQISLLDGTASNVDVNGDHDLSIAFWVGKWQKLFVASPLAFYTLQYKNEKNIQKISHEWIGAIIDTVPLDMAYDDVYDSLWIAEESSVHKLSAGGRLWRYGQRQGAPTANVTSVSASNGYIWVGTSFGVSRVSGNADATQKDELSTTYRLNSESDPWGWMYLSGNRYLPDNKVSAVVAGSPIGTGSLVLVTTYSGLALLEASPWTLAEKASAIGDFQEPRHNRHGLTTGVTLSAYGDLSSYQQECDDNDGLWTSMHAMGEVYRFLVTGEEQAREWAWTAFEGLEKLSILPGAYPTFPARSFCDLGEAASSPGCSGEPWVPSDVDANYMWKSTTSSDEIDGHLAIYPMIYDHIARNDEERARAYALIEGITGGILKNNLYLIDPSTGEPTHWGFWHPDLVNDDPEHYSERGTNSLGILAYCASAYSVTHDSKYKEKFWELALDYDYLGNCLNAKIDCPVEDNHSDNELLMQAYHILFYALQRLTGPDRPPHMQAPQEVVDEVRRMAEALIPSIERMWTIVGGELSPLWLGVYAGTANRPVTTKEISDATWTLRHWAIDMVG